MRPLPKRLVGHEPKIHHLTPPGNIRLKQLVHQPRHAAGQRFRAGDADVDVARMVAVAPGPRAEQEDLVAGIGDLLEADLPGLGEVAVFEGGAGGHGVGGGFSGLPVGATVYGVAGGIPPACAGGLLWG
jgi:hypothetical protein